MTKKIVTLYKNIAEKVIVWYENMTKKVTTLYIDDANIRLLVATGKRVRKWADLPLEPGLIKGAVIIKEAEVAAKIKQLLKDHKVKTRKIIVGMSGFRCLTRPITLPQLPKAMLEEAVIREARRTLPVPLEEFYVLWETLPAPPDKIQVFLAAIPCKAADALHKMLPRAGINPHLMDLKPLAVTRAVKEASAVIVDVQPTEFDIVIMVDGIPQPIRTVTFPSEVPSWQESLSTIREELDRTIKFYNSNSPERPVDSTMPIHVSGELALEPELCQSLSHELGHPVLPLSSPLECPEYLESSRYMVNIGLALKKLSPGQETGSLAVNLNMLPIPYQPKPPSLVKVVALPSTVTSILLIAYLAMLIQNTSGSIVSAQSQLDISNQLLQQRQAEEQAAENTADGTGPAEFITVLYSLGEQRNLINDDLKATVNSLPSYVGLTNISYTGSKLTVSGKAPSEAEVITYAKNLEASGRFSEIIITTMRGTETTGMTFTLAFNAGGQN